MRCPFYGYHANEKEKKLVAQQGNECGLLTHAYTPCRLEMAGQWPELEHCPLAGTGRQREFAQFTRIEIPRPLEAYPAAYPD